MKKIEGQIYVTIEKIVNVKWSHWGPRALVWSSSKKLDEVEFSEHMKKCVEQAYSYFLIADASFGSMDNKRSRIEVYMRRVRLCISHPIRQSLPQNKKCKKKGGYLPVCFLEQRGLDSWAPRLHPCWPYQGMYIRYKAHTLFNIFIF